jgi:uncharacterized coiled-coil protein SlyX
VTDILLWVIAAFALVTTVVSLRISGRVGETQRRLDEVSENLARTAARLEKLEMRIEEYWRGVEARVGKIHETFESGRACRMGGTVAEVDLKMGHLNRKMDELLERMSRSGQSTEAP